MDSILSPADPDLGPVFDGLANHGISVDENLAKSVQAYLSTLMSQYEELAAYLKQQT